jgi:hypothetical protein
VGDFAAQIDYLGAFRVLFDYFFRASFRAARWTYPIPCEVSGTRCSRPRSPAAWADDQATLELLPVAGAPDAEDLPFAGTTILDVLWYDIFALPDARQRLDGGQPYDNVGRAYEGPPTTWP